MKLTNKLIASFMAVALFASSTSSIVSFASVKADNAENMMAYERAFEAGLTTKANYSAFMPEAAVTREAAAKFLVKGAEALELTATSDQTCAYTDLSAADATLVSSINAGCDMGIFKAQTLFNPKSNLTRSQAELTIARLVYGMDEVSAYADDNNLSEFAAARELLMADEIVQVTIPSESAVKRLHLVLMLYRLADIPSVIDNGTGTVATGVVTTGVVVKPGLAEVSLVSTSATVSVPRNASAVKVGTIKLSAGANDTTVSSVVITRSGLGNAADIASVQLVGADGMTTDARTLSNASQSVTLKFTNVLTLKAGTSMNYDVVVGLAGAENNYHTFAVTAINVVNGTAQGTPVLLNTLNTSSYTVSTVAVSAIAVGSVVAGKSNQTFASVDLTPGKEGVINGFTVSKGAGEDYTKVMANLKAYHNNVVVGNVVVTSDKIIVSGLNIARLAGELAKIELKGDAVYVGPNASTTFKIAESTDVSVTEKVSGYIMPVSGFNQAPASLVLNGLDITITKITTGSTTVAPGASSVVLFNAQVKSDATFDISNYELAFSNSLADFSNGEVIAYINGVDYVLTAGRVFTANADRFRVEAGAPVTIKVVGSLKSNAVAPTDYTVTLKLTEAKNVSNGNTLAISKTQAGDKVTVKNGTAIVKTATIAPATTRTIFANTDLEIGRFAVRAEAEKVTITKLTLTNTAGLTNVDFTNFISSNGVKLVDVATNADISASVTVTATGIVFDSMSAEVLKDTDRNFKVVATTNGFLAAVHGQTVNLTATLNNVNKASGGSATLAPATLASVSSTPYSLGVKPPVITLVKKNANTFLMTVTNNDSESDVSLTNVTAQIKPVASTNSNNYNAAFCLRLEGTNDANACGASIGMVPGGAVAIMQTLPVTISKNSSITREIYIQSNFQDPIDLLAEISRISYNSTSEAYAVSAR